MGSIEISDIDMVLDVYTDLYPNDEVGAGAVQQYDELLAYVRGLEVAIERWDTYSPGYEPDLPPRPKWLHRDAVSVAQTSEKD